MLTYNNIHDVTENAYEVYVSGRDAKSTWQASLLKKEKFGRSDIFKGLGKASSGGV